MKQDTRKVNEILRALFAMPISMEQRLGAFFLWGMMRPEDPRAREKHLRAEAGARYRAAHREQVLEGKRIHRAANKEEINAKKRIWNSENAEYVSACLSLWKRGNPGKVRKHYRERERRRRQNPEYHVKQSLRHRLYIALKGLSKSARTFELLDMALPEFRIYLQGQFQPGMTWENYGPVWHLDHVRPCASFDLRDLAQQRECFNWSNYQPLFAKENLQKGAKYVSD